jgi:hypothetical protein
VTLKISDRHNQQQNVLKSVPRSNMDLRDIYLIQVDECRWAKGVVIFSRIYSLIQYNIKYYLCFIHASLMIIYLDVSDQLVFNNLGSSCSGDGERNNVE